MKLFYSLIIGFTLAIMTYNCNRPSQNLNNYDVVSVKYSLSVGRAGNEQIFVSEDSITAFAKGSKFDDRPNFSKKLKSDDWKNISQLINTIKLEKVASGPSKGHYDGKDEILEITTKEKSYIFTNVSDDDKEYLKINELRDKLKSLANNYK